MRILTVLMGLMVPLAASARGGGQGFGMGLAIGSPTGINVKNMLGQSTALDATLGLNFLNGRGFSVHACFLWQKALTTASSGKLDGYLGIGGKLGVYDDDERGKHDNDHDDSVWIGPRAPAGIAFVFRGAPVDIWLEVAAVLWVVEEADLDFDGTLGVRYWF